MTAGALHLRFLRVGLQLGLLERDAAGGGVADGLRARLDRGVEAVLHFHRRSALAGSLMNDPKAVIRLGELRAGALDNPLIHPLTGTPADVHLLVRQIQAAAAMGDSPYQARPASQLFEDFGGAAGKPGIALVELEPALLGRGDVAGRHNSGRSQIAEAYFRKFGGDFIGVALVLISVVRRINVSSFWMLSFNSASPPWI